MADDVWPDDVKALFALALVETCFRNTRLEDLHAGISPDSATGDYEDVKVVSPFGEIPWNRLSRLSDEEMKALMIEAVNKVYTFVSDPTDLLRLGGAARWNLPEHDTSLQRVAQRRAAVRDGMSAEDAWKAFPHIEDEDSSRTETSTRDVPGVGDEMSPELLRDLALSASNDIGWVRKAQEAMLVAASQWESCQLELLDADEIISSNT